MIRHEDDEMGRFSVDIELINSGDMEKMVAGEMPPDKVRKATIRGVVDTGATRLVISAKTAQTLGLRTLAETAVRYADGRTSQRKVAGYIHLTCLGRSGVFNAVVEPDRDSALIGAIVLEDLDLVVDCSRQTLAPRDPKQIISEI